VLAAVLAGCSGATPTTDAGMALRAESNAETITSNVASEEGAERQALTEEALADLDRAGAFLAAQQGFSFRADLSYDVMQSDGALLEFGGTREITVRRPDRLRLEATGRDGSTKTLTFDGAKISIDLPEHRAYVSIARPGSLYAALDHLVEGLGIPAPLEDLVGEDFASKVRSRIGAAYFVDSARLGDRLCDQLIYRLPDVDVQLWIEQGDRPLLCRISITYLREPGPPQFRASFREWNLATDVSDARFSFEPAAGARRLSVEQVERDVGEGQ